MSAGATTRRIRRRASIYRGWKAEVIAAQSANTLDEALTLAAARGKGPADVRSILISQIGELHRNLASRLREVRRLPHMRAYHSRFGIGELTLLRFARAMLTELDERFTV